MRQFNKGGSRKDSRQGGGFRGDSGRGGFRRDSGPRKMFKATCAECGQECEVPFKPTEGKPVFCRECYRKKRGF